MLDDFLSTGELRGECPGTKERATNSKIEKKIIQTYWHWIGVEKHYTKPFIDCHMESTEIDR